MSLNFLEVLEKLKGYVEEGHNALYLTEDDRFDEEEKAFFLAIGLFFAAADEPEETLEAALRCRRAGAQ